MYFSHVTCGLRIRATEYIYDSRHTIRQENLFLKREGAQPSNRKIPLAMYIFMIHGYSRCGSPQVYCSTLYERKIRVHHILTKVLVS